MLGFRRVFVFLTLATAVGCGGSSKKRNGDGQGGDSSGQGGSTIQGGTASGGASAGKGTGGSAAVSGSASGEAGAGAMGGMPPTGGAGSGGMPDPDPPIAPCVSAAVEVRWTGGALAQNESFELVVVEDAVAVVRRKPDSPTEIRSYSLDGSALGQAVLEDDVRLLPTDDGRILLISTAGNTLFGRHRNAALSDETADFSTNAGMMERTLAALEGPNGVLVLTDARFLNATLGLEVTWSDLLVTEPDVEPPSAETRFYGAAASRDLVLVAWGVNTTLTILSLTGDGELLDDVSRPDFLPYPANENAMGFPFGDELVLLHGNPVKTTRIGFDATIYDPATNLEMRPFYRTAPALAFAAYGDRPIGFWLAVTPPADGSQGIDPNEVYGCEFALADPTTCIHRFLVAEVGFDGYAIDYEPLAATVIGDTAAVAHTDTSGRSWLRFVDLGCALEAR